jgi:hypothetical protein
MKLPTFYSFLVITLLSLPYFKVGFSSEILIHERYEDKKKVIPIKITTQIRSTDCNLVYSFIYRGKDNYHSGSIFIPKQVGDISKTILFEIKKDLISFISLAIYNTDKENQETEEEIDKTALALLNMKSRIRTFEKINLKLTQADHINIELEAEYYLPPPFPLIEVQK